MQRKRTDCKIIAAQLRISMSCLLILVFTGSYSGLQAQSTTRERLWFDMGGGAMQYGGSMPDIQAKAAVGLGLQYEITDQLHLQLSFTASEAGGSDSSLNNLAHMGNDRSSQGYYFRTNINEFTLTSTYDFFNLNAGRRFTPYVLAGVGLYNFKPYQVVQYENEKGALRKENRAMKQVESFSNWQVNIPVGIGIKYAFSSNFRLKLEGKYRVLFNPYLDNYIADQKNDHYYSVTLGLAFRLQSVSAFARGTRRNSRDCNCPPVY